MAKKMICPNGCNASFIATAHIVQEWEVDSEGNFLNVSHDCIEVAHRPDPDNIWTCTKCGAEGIWTDVPDEPGTNGAADSDPVQEKPPDRKSEFYQVAFHLSLTPGHEITEITKALSSAIADEINQEFPEIDFVSSCEFKQEKE